MPTAKAGALPPQQQRLNILFNAKQAGKELRPEHEAELERLMASGLTPTVNANSQTTIDANIRQAVNMSAKVDRALGSVSGTTAGAFGSMLGRIPGTEGRDLRADIDTLKANLTFDELKKLKQAASSGASGLGALSDREGQLLAATVANLDPEQSPERLRQNLQEVRSHYDAWLGSLGYSDDQLKAANNGVNPLAAGAGEARPPSVGGSSDGSPNNGELNAPTEETGAVAINGAPTAQSFEPSTDTQTQIDPELEGLNTQVADMIRARAPASAVRNAILTAGIDPAKVANIDQWVDFIKKNPRYEGPIDVRLNQQDVPLSAMRSVLSGAADSPAGTYAVSAADGLTGGFLDELAPGNTALNNLGKEALFSRNPTASTLGGVTGGALAALGGEGLLAARGVRYAAPIADTLYGAVTGAGENNDSRLTGAALGGGLGLGGGVLGRTAGNALGGLASPTGGRLGGLYEAGVRPSPGQYFGGIANTVEEKLQSVPVLGDMIRGTRQRARDQFERGAFNDALGEIGGNLPDDVDLGTGPHDYMQGAFNDAYDTARGNMSVAFDGQHASELGALQRQNLNGGLTEASQRRFENVVTDAVGRRANGTGALTGDQYKDAISDITSRARAIRSSPQGDHELADALESYATILDDTARRSSGPDAADYLDAVDRGYAKAVRMENAGARRGGGTGRFTPTQFDAAVQQTSGGTRSRAYLRGDALMGDYAEQGMNLADRFPNSGTTDRLLLGGALAGGAYVEPTTAALTGLATLPYAPGVRNVTTGLLAPRPNQPAALNTLGALLRSQQAQSTLGATGAGGLLSYYGGQ